MHRQKTVADMQFCRCTATARVKCQTGLIYCEVAAQTLGFHTHEAAAGRSLWKRGGAHERAHFWASNVVL